MEKEKKITTKTTKTTTRVNITLSIELKDWFDKQAGAFGCPTSSLMSIALAEYKKQNDMLKEIGSFQKIIEKLQETQAINKLQEIKKK